MSEILKIDSLDFSYDKKTYVFKDLNLGLKQGEIACLLGPSGCGKTSLLRCIAGFEKPQAGTIEIDGKSVHSMAHHTPVQNRHVGLVFQDFALFPHLNVRKNITFGLQKNSQLTFVDDLIKMFEIEQLMNRFPHELSGGQQQRVAVVRALAPQPKLLLLDEPFSNIDPHLRSKMTKQLRAILKELGVTSLFVTHDQTEAFDLADHVGLMIEGKLVQWGTPHELYFNPNTRQVAEFFGKGSFVAGLIVKDNPLVIETQMGLMECAIPLNSSPQAGKNVSLFLRPEQCRVSDQSPIKGCIKDIAFRGDFQLISVELSDGSGILCLEKGNRRFELGSSCGVEIVAPPTRVFH